MTAWRIFVVLFRKLKAQLMPWLRRTEIRGKAEVVGELQEGMGTYFVLLANLYHQNPNQIRSLKIYLERPRDFGPWEIPAQVHTSHLAAYLWWCKAFLVLCPYMAAELLPWWAAVGAWRCAILCWPSQSMIFLFWAGGTCNFRACALHSSSSEGKLGLRES